MVGPTYRTSLAGVRNPLNSLVALVFCTTIRFLWGASPMPSERGADATFSIFFADSARDAQRSRDRVSPADAARRHGPAGGVRYLCLLAARIACTQQRLQHCARRAGSRRGHRIANADHPIGRPVPVDGTVSP